MISSNSFFWSSVRRASKSSLAFVEIASSCSFCSSDNFNCSRTNDGRFNSPKRGKSPKGPKPPGPGPPFVGFTYFQTISLAGVTSNTVPLAPEQMSVLPFASRWAPEMKLE